MISVQLQTKLGSFGAEIRTAASAHIYGPPMQIGGAPRRMVAFIPFGAPIQWTAHACWDTSRAAQRERDADGIVYPKLTAAARRQAIALHEQALGEGIAWTGQLSLMNLAVSEEVTRMSDMAEGYRGLIKQDVDSQGDGTVATYAAESLAKVELVLEMHVAVLYFLEQKPNEEQFRLAMELTGYQRDSLEKQKTPPTWRGGEQDLWLQIHAATV